MAGEHRRLSQGPPYLARSIDWPTFRRSELPDCSASDLRVEALSRDETIPSSWYVRPEFHKADEANILAASWQFAGAVQDLANPGEFLRVRVAGQPVLVVRGDDGEIHGFYDVCRHRGGPLSVKPGSRCMLQCRYHGWTYRMDGRLRGVPDFDYVELFDKKDFSLIPVEVGTWQGLVFVRLRDGEPTLDEWLAGIAERIAPWTLATKKRAHKESYEIACNWKVYVDNYLEGYHLPLVHPELSKLLDYRRYVTEVGEWSSLQHSPFSGEGHPYADPNTPNEEGRAFYYFLFPNFMLNILPGRLQTNRVVPLGPDRCRVDFEYFYDDLDSAASAGRVEEDVRSSDEIQQEDIEICEDVHQRLASHVYDRGRFSVKRESGVHHFHSRLRRSYERLPE